LSCDDCEFRDDCSVRKIYFEADGRYREGDIDELRKISNLIELHEQYIVEMRRDVNHKLVD
jgi:hypothetical protein